LHHEFECHSCTLSIAIQSIVKSNEILHWFVVVVCFERDNALLDIDTNERTLIIVDISNKFDFNLAFVEQRTLTTNTIDDKVIAIGIVHDNVVTPVDETSLSSSNTDGSKKSTDNLLA
jgi:hypothetical protein